MGYVSINRYRNFNELKIWKRYTCTSVPWASSKSPLFYLFFFFLTIHSFIHCIFVIYVELFFNASFNPQSRGLPLRDVSWGGIIREEAGYFFSFIVWFLTKRVSNQSIAKLKLSGKKKKKQDQRCVRWASKGISHGRDLSFRFWRREGVSIGSSFAEVQCLKSSQRQWTCMGKNKPFQLMSVHTVEPNWPGPQLVPENQKINSYKNNQWNQQQKRKFDSEQNKKISPDSVMPG